MSNHKTTSADSEGEAVCNYDTNVTTLYELLESSNWEKARNRCRTHPHEVRTWIVRRDTISQKVRWKLLPLHAAVIFQSPTFVVSALIDNYPAAVSRRDDQGMLPLHLAFRYKEDNEDLLELLLTQYPKGVLMKDKRDRVPLEHGRGSKFSAKLLTLYAEANVAGSRALTMNGSDSHNKLHDPTGRVSDVIAEYEKKTRTLKSMYEERIKMIQDQHKAAINQVRLSTDEDKRKLVNCHVEEMETMRGMINSHAGNDAGVIHDLEEEISQLRASAAGAKAERDSSNIHAADMKNYADELSLQMRQLLRDQEALQLLVSQQQQELDKAHSRREQLIQNLLRQEQEERPNRVRRGTEIKSLIESGRTTMETLLAREPTKQSPSKLQKSHSHDLDHRHSRDQERDTRNIGRGNISNDKGGRHNYYSGAPMNNPIKDDISAITENSNF